MSDDFDEVRALARAGRKIDAIKLLRERSQLGLVEAKQWVEACVDGKEWAITPPPPPVGAPGAAILFDDAGPSASDIDRQIREGALINAIKLVRERTACSLREAKEFVERRKGELGL